MGYPAQAGAHVGEADNQSMHFGYLTYCSQLNTNTGH